MSPYSSLQLVTEVCISPPSGGDIYCGWLLYPYMYIFTGPVATSLLCFIHLLNIGHQYWKLLIMRRPMELYSQDWPYWTEDQDENSDVCSFQLASKTNHTDVLLIAACHRSSTPSQPAAPSNRSPHFAPQDSTSTQCLSNSSNECRGNTGC